MLDYQVIIDTREQTPWLFKNSVCAKLDTGDYSLFGYEQLLSIERKASTGEFYQNIIQDRFENELERMSAIRYGFVILEFDMADILSFPRNSGIPTHVWSKLKMTNNFMLKRLLEFQIKYNTKILFCGQHGREVASSIFKRVIEYEQI